MPKQKGQEIIYLDKENYKDSVVLYSYAYAQEIYSKNENFKASIDQANEQCSAIPDTYKGALCEEIIKFKKDISEKKIVLDETQDD